jgi:hypothetical protein
MRLESEATHCECDMTYHGNLHKPFALSFPSSERHGTRMWIVRITCCLIASDTYNRIAPAFESPPTCVTIFRGSSLYFPTLRMPKWPFAYAFDPRTSSTLSTVIEQNVVHWKFLKYHRHSHRTICSTRWIAGHNSDSQSSTTRVYIA